MERGEEEVCIARDAFLPRLIRRVPVRNLHVQAPDSEYLEPEVKVEERFEGVFANAVVCPDAVMVHHRHAFLALTAVVNSRVRSLHSTLFTNNITKLTCFYTFFRIFLCFILIFVRKDISRIIIASPDVPVKGWQSETKSDEKVELTFICVHSVISDEVSVYG